MTPRVRIRQVTDPRTAEQIGRGRAIEQEQTDIRLEAEWRRRVRENVARRVAAGRYSLFSHKGNT